MKKFLVVLILCSFGKVFGQPLMDQAPNLFKQEDIKVTGRIRQLTLENVFAGNEKEIVTMSRDGEFPNWKGLLAFWKFNTSGKRFEKITEWEMPKETILYGFIPVNQGNSFLILVLPSKY